MSDTGPESIACVSCRAPLGTAGGRCPFCGTVQPEVVQPKFEAAIVGTTRTQPRPAAAAPPSTPAPARRTVALVAATVGVVAIASIGWFASHPPPSSTPTPGTSRPTTPPAPSNSATLGGVDVRDVARVEPGDVLPQLRKKLAPWDAEARLVDIVVTGANAQVVDLGKPGAQIVYRFASLRPAPVAAKQEQHETMQFVLKQGAPAPSIVVAPVAAAHLVHEPTCVFSAAYRAAVSSGLPANATIEARYGYSARLGEASWQFSTTERPITQRELDANTCAIKAN